MLDFKFESCSDQQTEILSARLIIDFFSKWEE